MKPGHRPSAALLCTGHQTAIADVAGMPVSAEVAARIANSIGPAFEGFAAIAGTLPFDLESASFVVVQAAKASK
jgi:hypothetical protein